MKRWLPALQNALLLILGAAGMALLYGFLDPVNEVDAKVTSERREQARAAKEAIPPAALFEHPLRDCTWHANWGPGEIPQPRCYQTKARRER